MIRGGMQMYKNHGGYSDPVAGKAITRAMKLLCGICHVRVLGKVTAVDEKGRRW